MDTNLKRKDKAALKELNLRAYRFGDDKMKQCLTNIASSPMVILETMDAVTLHEVFKGANKTTLQKIHSAGLDCMFNPFYRRCVYHRADGAGGFLYLDVDDEKKIHGVVYENHGGGYISIPTVVTRDILNVNLEDYDSVFVDRCFVDFEEIAGSVSIRLAIKAFYKKISSGEETPTAVFSESQKLTLESIEAGTHSATRDDIKAAGLTINEYVAIAPLASKAVGLALLCLGYMHINDYYPFEAAPKSNKKKATQKKKTNPVLSPNKTIVRLIQRAVAEEHLANEPGNGGKQKPHSRRGYWVTLNAERFKNHAMYKVKNGVYRRESWIGGESFSIGNVIYIPRK